MFERYLYKKFFELLLGDSYEVVNRVIDYSVKAIKKDREKFFRAPVLTGVMEALSEEYKGLIDGMVGFMRDDCGCTYLSKDLLKLSLDVTVYLKEKLERELDSNQIRP